MVFTRALEGPVNQAKAANGRNVCGWSSLLLQTNRRLHRARRKYRHRETAQPKHADHLQATTRMASESVELMRAYSSSSLSPGFAFTRSRSLLIRLLEAGVSVPR